MGRLKRAASVNEAAFSADTWSLTAGADWRHVLIAVAAATGMLASKMNPLWLLGAGGIAGMLLL